MIALAARYEQGWPNFGGPFFGKLWPLGDRPVLAASAVSRPLLQAAVTGLKPRQPYILGLALHADGSGRIEPLASFITNPVGAAIVNAIGPIRQITQGNTSGQQSWLVVTEGVSASPGQVVQVQTLPPRPDGWTVN